jgi:hypothetical protein
LQDALGQKEIQLYFNDPETEKLVREFGWDGKIIDTKKNQDYLFIVNSNINAHKSDARIDQKIDFQSVVQPDGSIINTVIINKTHTGSKEEQFYGWTNIDYVRTYVPEGSALISANGFSWIDEKNFKAPKKWYEKDATLAALEKEIALDPLTGTRITNEFGKTSFGNWIVTEPGSTSQASFTYRLPFKISGDSIKQKKWIQLLESDQKTAVHQLIVQKQSGTNSQFKGKIIFPSGWHPIWENGEQIKLASNGAQIMDVHLNNDKIWGLIMANNK